MALAILSTLSPDEISYALATKDTTAFSRVSGVGKKLAERIITELKDKYSSSYISEIPITSSAGKDSGINNIAIDSISALVALGVNKAEAQNRVNTLLAQDRNISLNELIKLALKN
jgi:Holliday junction DNA helicase RuvA